MKKYDLTKLPKMWYVNIKAECNHPRLQEFKEIYTEACGQSRTYVLDKYGVNGRLFVWGRKTDVCEPLLLDEFFELIDIKEELKLDIGNWIASTQDIGTLITKDKPYQIRRSSTYGLAIQADDSTLLDLNKLLNSCFIVFYNLTPKGFSSISSNDGTEWVPERGQKVLIKGFLFEHFENTPMNYFDTHKDGFVVYYNEGECNVFRHVRDVKPYEAPLPFQPQIDEIVKLAKEAGYELSFKCEKV